MGTEKQSDSTEKGGGNDIVEKFRSTSVGEKIILVGTVVLLIDSFLPWYSVDVGLLVSVHRSGWQSPGALWSILALLIAIAMSAVILVRLFGAAGTLPANVSGITWPRIMLGAGAAAALSVLIKLINESSHLGIGFFIGILCVAALTAGGFFMYREEQGNPIL